MEAIQSEISLKSIDELIENSNKYDSSSKYLSILAKQIIPFLSLDDSDLTYQALINREIEQSKKRFIALCLLRVYSKNSILLTNPIVKHNIHTLFEQSIPDIYGYLKIDNRTETYEKESKLSSYVKDIENITASKIGKEVDFHFIQNFLNSYRSAIKQRKTNPIVWQFFSFDMDEQLFDNVFKVLEDYKNSELKKKYELYTKAISIVEDIIDISNSIGTKYCQEYITRPFSLIKEALIKDFKNNPHSKPADLVIKKTPKKYPFAQNANYKLQFLIENNSTGYAKNVVVKISLYSDELIKIEQREKYIGLVEASSIVEFDYVGIKNAERVFYYMDISNG